MSIKIIKNENGQETSIEFESSVDAAKALGVLFGGQSAQDIEAQETRQRLNDALRGEFRRRQSTSNPRALIENARASNRWQGE